MKNYFSNNFLNENVNHNFLQFIIYKTAIPIAIIFKRFGFTPNGVTFLSFFLCLVSSYFLLCEQIIFFLVLWYSSHFLDYVDGTLARMTNNKTKILLRIDHMSDLIKIHITLISICIHYNNIGVWISFSLFNLIFWCGELLSQQYSQNLKSNTDKPYRPIFLNKILKNFYFIFFTFNGHSLFLLGIAIINSSFFIGLLVYFSLLTLKRLYSPIIYLSTNFRK